VQFTRSDNPVMSFNIIHPALGFVSAKQSSGQHLVDRMVAFVQLSSCLSPGDGCFRLPFRAVCFSGQSHTWETEQRQMNN